MLALAAVVVFATWLIVHHFGTTGSTGAKPAVSTVTASELAAAAAASGRPIYWAGPQDGATYELTENPDGSANVRYLPAGASTSDPTPYLTVATYPLRNAFADTVAASRRSGAVKLNVAARGVAFYESGRPTNVYEAFQGSDYQIEVFAPSAHQARQIVTAGRVAHVGLPAAPKPHPVAASGRTLAAKVAAAGHPVYWLGSRRGDKYEVTLLPNGRVYLRYLPRTAPIGTDVVYLTVGTYPVKNAYAITSSAARQPNAVKIPVKGAVAFYSKSRPQSVYVAFPGVDEQIEIYDPTPLAAVPLVAAGTLVQVP
jgi:hypothetical protein